MKRETLPQVLSSAGVMSLSMGLMAYEVGRMVSQIAERARYPFHPHHRISIHHPSMKVFYRPSFLNCSCACQKVGAP